jgi:branched-chain amino acid transport system substrate-binding protein
VTGRLLATFALLLALGGAGASAQTGANRTPYAIGVTFPLTGPLAEITSEYIPALQLAVAHVNAAGGVNGHPLRLVMEDTQGTPQGGIAAMRKLVQVDGVQAIVTIYTNVVTAQIPLADELKVPIMATVETDVMTRGQYSFGNAPTITDIGPFFGRFWKAKHVGRIFALLGDNAWGHSVAPEARREATAAGATYDEAFLDLNAADYRGVIARVKDFNPDGVFVSAQGTAVETTAIRQVRELGLTTQIYVAANVYGSNNYRAALGPYAEGIIFGGLYVDPSRPTPFLRDYRAREHHDPVYPAAENYDEIRLYAAALVGTPYNGAAIRDALLAGRSAPSAFGGTVAMRPNHYTTIAGLGLFQVRRGKLVTIFGGPTAR